jgi:ketosteroid isomerase-like protein
MSDTLASTLKQKRRTFIPSPSRDTGLVMSQEKVALVHRMFEAFAEGRADEALAIFDENVQWHTAADEPDAFRPYRGLAGIGELLATWSDTWADGFERAALEAFESAVEGEQIVEAGPHLIVPLRPRLRGRASGAEVEAPETYVLTFRAGRIIEVREYRTKTEALVAMGLSE